jgi:hypothetical protein
MLGPSWAFPTGILTFLQKSSTHSEITSSFCRLNVMETRFISVEPVAIAVPAPVPQAAFIGSAPIPMAATGGALQRLGAALGGAGPGTSLKRGRDSSTPANKGRSDKVPRDDPVHGARAAPLAGTLPQSFENCVIAKSHAPKRSIACCIYYVMQVIKGWSIDLLHSLQQVLRRKVQ